MMNHKESLENKMMKYRVLFAGFFAAVLLCGCGKKETFADLMTKAEQDAITGKWETALEYSKDAWKKNPASLEAALLTTLAYEQNGKINEALPEIQKALKLAPKNYFGLYTYGRILYKFKRNDDAMAALNEALKQKPDCTAARILLARIAAEQKDYRTNATQLNALLKDKKYQEKALLYNEIGIYYVQVRKNNRSGLQWCAAAAKLDAVNPVYTLNTAVIQDKTGKIAAARSGYQKYLELTKHDQSLAGKRASVENRLKQLQAR